jgi:hypothetical protein
MEASMSLTRWLLACGIAGAALFLAMDCVAAFWLHPGYDITSQQVSELSAIGAPSRSFWMTLGFPHAALTFAFAYGVWRASAGRWSVMTTAILLALFALNSFLWGWVAPMHMRGVAFTSTDTLHIVFTVVAVLLMVGFMTIGARAFDGRFRWFSGVTIVAMLVCGGMVGTQVPAIAQGLPTPWMGLVERVSVYAPSLWMVVLALMLMGEIEDRKGDPAAMPSRSAPR